MLENKQTLSVLETVSQGLISAKCIGQDWLKDASYKQDINQFIADLGINQQDDLAKTAEIIAQKLKQHHDADLILVQLYQGDKEKFHDKQQNIVIVIYNVLLTPGGIYQETKTVTGPIKRKQHQAAIRALDLLRRYLQKCL